MMSLKKSLFSGLCRSLCKWGVLTLSVLILVGQNDLKAREQNETHLVLIGGGSNRPQAALQTFASWSGNRILVIAWASEIPQEVAEGVQADLKPHFDGEFDFSLSPPNTIGEQHEFLEKLANASGVFFTGGDQKRILEVFKTPNNDASDSAIKKALIASFQNGVAFGGTSAGTAVMSNFSIIGVDDDNHVLIENGLGLLPKNTIVDQHFSQRNRRERLLSAQKSLGLPYAIGIDENTALLVTSSKSNNSANSQVVGENAVYVYHLKKDQKMIERVYKNGESLSISGTSCLNLFNK